MLSAVEIIAAKRDGKTLTDEQIDWVVDAYTRGDVAEEQMAALAMAIVCRGMTVAETARWTDAMVCSGERLSWGDLGRPTVDKHSTGGVGDKITLVLAPLVAACGAAVPQLSGRALGHTGGTLDKMEAISGWRADLTVEEIVSCLRSAGAVVCAATGDLAPADRKLYALRDITATVESIPLIAASIMSKKIAAAPQSLVLDVKTGSGAFMSDPARARELAEVMVGIGNAAGVRTRALITAMDVPLGLSAGNACEVAEAVDVLMGGGPEDVRDLSVLLARHMLELSGVLDAPDPERVLADGRAMDSWSRMIRAQGGDPHSPLPAPHHTVEIAAPRSGVLTRLDARAVGVAAWRLGAGRSVPGEAVLATAGVTWTARPGEHVTAGGTLLRLHTDDETRIPAALDALEGAWSIQDEDTPADRLPLVVAQVG